LEPAAQSNSPPLLTWNYQKISKKQQHFGNYGGGGRYIFLRSAV
jgi:hypothetical protein